MAALLSLRRRLGGWVCSLIPIFHSKVMCLVNFAMCSHWQMQNN